MACFTEPGKVLAVGCHLAASNQLPVSPRIAGVSDTLYVQPAQPAEDSAGGCTADLVLPILSYFVQEWDTEENIEE